MKFRRKEPHLTQTKQNVSLVLTMKVRIVLPNSFSGNLVKDFHRKNFLLILL